MNKALKKAEDYPTVVPASKVAAIKSRIAQVAKKVAKLNVQRRKMFSGMMDSKDIYVSIAPFRSDNDCFQEDKEYTPPPKQDFGNFNSVGKEDSSAKDGSLMDKIKSVLCCKKKAKVDNDWMYKTAEDLQKEDGGSDDEVETGGLKYRGQVGEESVEHSLKK